MNRKSYLLFVLSFMSFTMIHTGFLSAQILDGRLGLFEQNADVGNVKIAGSAYYNVEKQEYTLQGSGKNIWFGSDSSSSSKSSKNPLADRTIDHP